MRYTLSQGYRWYKTPRSECIVLMYFINDFVYTYDNIPKLIQDNPEVILEATANHVYTEDEVYWASYYLLQEEAHPLIFPLNLKNPDLLPTDQ
jgi:hypothetical protein